MCAYGVHTGDGVYAHVCARPHIDVHTHPPVHTHTVSGVPVLVCARTCVCVQDCIAAHRSQPPFLSLPGFLGHILNIPLYLCVTFSRLLIPFHTKEHRGHSKTWLSHPVSSSAPETRGVCQPWSPLWPGTCISWDKRSLAQSYLLALGLTNTFGKFKPVPVRLRRG